MINHAATGWDAPEFKGIRPGTMVPFQIGLDTVCAKVLGLVRDGEQYLLLLTFDKQHDVTGEWYTMRRYYQRDRRFIEGLYRDAGGSI